jgi:riboflavin-specific deaminase-like protein
VAHYGRALADVILDARDFPLQRLRAGSGASVTLRPIDERTAWDLVRAVTPGSAATSPVRVRVPSDAEAWLEVDGAGAWEASRPVSEAARDIFDIYLPLRTPSSLVMGQLGQSLDGRIATESGASHFVTGEKDIERLHRLRALMDAVIVGARTVAADDPLLTARLAEGANPVRIVLDPSARLDPERRVFSDPGARTLVVRGTAAGAEGGGDRVGELSIPWREPGELDLRALLERLRALGLARVLVEGGGVTVSRFLEAGLLDRLHICVAPLLIGSGRPSISLRPVKRLDQALRPACRRFMLGDDVLFDLDLRADPR